MTLAFPLGQGKPLRRVADSVALGRPHHAYLVSSPSLDDARQASLWIAAVMNCTASEAQPCGECSSCRRIVTGQHPDLLEVEADGTFIKVEQVRELIAQLAYQKHDARYRVVRIHGAERMRTESANALLKVLEEPPEGTVLILETSSEAALLSTIRSRCQSLRLGPVPQQVLVDHLQREEGMDREEAVVRARHARGSLERALAEGPEQLQERRERCEAVVSSWRQPLPLRVELAGQLSADKDQVRLLYGDLYALCRDVMALRAGAPHDDADPLVQSLDQLFPADRLDALCSHLEGLDGLLVRNVQSRLIVENLLLMEPRRQA